VGVEDTVRKREVSRNVPVSPFICVVCDADRGWYSDGDVLRRCVRDISPWSGVLERPEATLAAVSSKVDDSVKVSGLAVLDAEAPRCVSFEVPVSCCPDAARVSVRLMELI
jgi:hypothetical protein